MGFATALPFVFRESWAFFRVGWWIVLLPAGLAGVGALVLERFPDRIDAAIWIGAALYAIWLAALPYWVLRFIALEHDLTAAISINRASARTFAPFFYATLALALVSPIVGEVTGDPLAWAAVVLFNLVVILLLSAWALTAPSGSRIIGPVQSARLVLPHLLWALALAMIVIVPVALLQFIVDAFLFDIGTRLAAAPFYDLAGLIAGLAVGAVLDMALIVILFVVAYRAGVRIGGDGTLSNVFE